MFMLPQDVSNKLRKGNILRPTTTARTSTY